MNLAEYYAEFHRFITGEVGNFPAHVAAEIAAAHEIGLTFEQLKRFLARRTEITSVSSALVASTLPVETVQRILDARSDGAVLPNGILSQAFSPEEVRQELRAKVFAGS